MNSADPPARAAADAGGAEASGAPPLPALSCRPCQALCLVAYLPLLVAAVFLETFWPAVLAAAVHGLGVAWLASARRPAPAPVAARPAAPPVAPRPAEPDELQEITRDFLTLLENTSDFIYFKDGDSRFRFCSQPLAEITGHRHWREMIGKHDREVFPEDTARIYTEEESPVFERGEAVRNRVDPYYDAAGRPGWVSTSKWPLRDADGRVIGIFGISRDITELHETHGKLEDRAKEAECLSDVIALSLDDSLDVAAFLRACAHLIPTGWRFPKETAAQIRIGRQSYRSPGFVDSPHTLTAPIQHLKGSVGEIAVRYVGSRSFHGKSPFLPEEARLLAAIASQIGHAIERRQAIDALQERDFRHRLVVEATGVIVWDWNLLADTLTWSEHLHRQFGLAAVADESGWAWWEKHVHPDDYLGMLDKVEEHLKGAGSIWQGELRLRRGDGGWVDIQIWGIALRSVGGATQRMVGAILDISQRRADESRMRLSASVFSHAQEGIAVTAASGEILDVNDAFTRITGYERHEVVGQNPKMLRSDRHDAEFYGALWRDLKSHGQWTGEMWNRHKNGRIYAALVKISAVPDPSGQPQQYVALYNDITTLKQQQAQLTRTAHYDALTGLPNRVLLADRLRQATIQSRRRQQPMAVVYLDLDGFKEVNDSLGHSCGDELLVKVTARLKNNLRDGDTLARLGGDEFIAVLVDLHNADECDQILTRLLQAVALPIQVNDQAVRISASAGVTLFPDDDSDPDSLLRHADQAMYKAKQAGKNRYHLFDTEKNRRTASRTKSAHRVARALADGELVLHYQPQTDLRSGRPVGVEALLRWQDPERGLLAPGDFLPQIKDADLLVRIDEWVLTQALAQLAAWHDAGLDLRLGVNISPPLLQQPDFAIRLHTLLAAHPQLPRGALELEILETAALDDIPQASRVIADCHRLGVEFALDDFGTGYSSLTYLKDLPANTLKIDRVFVRDMLWDSGDLAIVEGVIGMSGAFRRTVVAEGVATLEHADLLLRLGCDIVQGFGIAQPMPADQLAAWLAAWQPPAAWHDRDKSRPSRDELQLIGAEVGLRQWTRSLEAAAKGETGDLPAFESNRFAEWFNHEGQSRYGDASAFAPIVPLHAELAALGSEFKALHAGGAHHRLGGLVSRAGKLQHDLTGHLRRLAPAAGR